MSHPPISLHYMHTTLSLLPAEPRLLEGGVVAAVLGEGLLALALEALELGEGARLEVETHRVDIHLFLEDGGCLVVLGEVVGCVVRHGGHLGCGGEACRSARGMHDTRTHLHDEQIFPAGAGAWWCLC